MCENVLVLRKNLTTYGIKNVINVELIHKWKCRCLSYNGGYFSRHFLMRFSWYWSVQWSKGSAQCVMYNFHSVTHVIRSLKPLALEWNSIFWSLMIKHWNCGCSLWFGLQNLPWLWLTGVFPLLLMTMMLKDKPEKFVKMEKIGNGILLLNMGITLKNCNNLY